VQARHPQNHPLYFDDLGNLGVIKIVFLTREEGFFAG
jgi:hypothetical protein